MVALAKSRRLEELADEIIKAWDTEGMENPYAHREHALNVRVVQEQVKLRDKLARRFALMIEHSSMDSVAGGLIADYVMKLTRGDDLSA